MWFLHQLNLNQIQTSVVAKAFSSYAKFDSQHAISMALCVGGVQVCVCACVGVHVNEKSRERGLRRQQLAWELQGHGTGIDFINRLSQHLGSGCNRAPLETHNVGQKQTGRTDKAHLHHFILTVKLFERKTQTEHV